MKGGIQDKGMKKDIFSKNVFLLLIWVLDKTDAIIKENVAGDW